MLRKCGKVPSIRQVAKTLGEAPMAIYHYFPKKAALLETMLSMSDVGRAQIFVSRLQVIISLLQLPDSDMKDAIGLLVDYLHGFALAMRCNSGNLPLTVDKIGGPIKFYLEALEGKSRKIS